MASVMGLLEERELAARVRTEALREEADRVLAALADSESEWQEWVIARQRVGVVLRDGPAVVVPAQALAVEAVGAVAAGAVLPPTVGRVVSAAVAPGAVRVSAGASRTVAVWAPGLQAQALRENYRAVVEALASVTRSGGEAVTRSCPELAAALGLEVTKNNVEGRVRHVAKRLVERGWLVEPVQGRFRLADGPAAAS